MALSLNRQRGARARLAVAFVSALAVAGCVRDNTPDSAAGAAQPAGPPPLVLGGDAPWPPRYAADALWSRAASGDDFALARLAGRDGAEELIAALGEGGSLGRVALGALPFARDRYAARGPLCALLPRADAAGRALLLEALFAVVIGAPVTEEAVDSSADALCVRELDALAQREQDAPSVRDRAQALRGRLSTP